MRRSVKDGICEVDCVDHPYVQGALAVLPSERALRDTASAIKALANPNRLRILWALEGRELCVCDLAQVLAMSFSGTSQQLKALRELGAIDYRTEGKLVYYTLTDPFWLGLARSVGRQLDIDQGAAASVRTGGAKAGGKGTSRKRVGEKRAGREKKRA